MQEKNPLKLMTLKNGAKIDPAFGLAILGLLESIVEKHPKTFQAMLAFAEGRGDSVSPGMVQHLKECLLLGQDGIFADEIRDVLLSGYQADPGPMMVNPFRLESKDQVRTLEMHEDEMFRRLARWIRDGGPDEDKGLQR